MTASTTAGGDSPMRLAPFIYFYGRCEEALTHYAAAFGGSYNVNMRNTGADGDFRLNPSFEGKVSQAEFHGPGISFMASDGAGPRAIDPAAGNISLVVTIPDTAAGTHAFSLLADGGTIKTPLGPAPWGGTFGIVHDRFGTEWIVNIG